MKKSLIIATTFLSILGIMAVAHAAVAPVVNAGTAQTITLPTNTVTLTGTATPEVSTTVLATTWSVSPVQAGVIINTPTSLSTTVTGLTVGEYTFTLTAVDNSVSTAPLTGTSTVKVMVKPEGSQNSDNQQMNSKMKIEINPQGQVNLQGVVDTAQNGTILVVKVWGITFNVETKNAKFGTLANNISLYKVGDLVSIKGVMDTTITSPTINARSISNMNINNRKDKINRENERKQEEEMNREDGNKFPSLDVRNEIKDLNEQGKNMENEVKKNNENRQGDN